MPSPEYVIQSRFVTQVELLYPDLLFTISPAGFIMSAGQAMKMMRMGYRKGTPDWLCFEPRGQYHGLLIEFKRPGGVVSEEQKDFMLRAGNKGYQTAFCFSTEQGMAALQLYLAEDRSLPVQCKTESQLCQQSFVPRYSINCKAGGTSAPEKNP